MTSNGFRVWLPRDMNELIWTALGIACVIGTVLWRLIISIAVQPLPLGGDSQLRPEVPAAMLRQILWCLCWVRAPICEETCQSAGHEALSLSEQGRRTLSSLLSHAKAPNSVEA